MAVTPKMEIQKHLLLLLLSKKIIMYVFKVRDHINLLEDCHPRRLCDGWSVSV